MIQALFMTPILPANLKRSTFFFVLLCCFFFGCSSPNEQEKPQPHSSLGGENPQDKPPSSDNPQENPSTPSDNQDESFFGHLQGIYQGTYQGIRKTNHFEVWIEKTGQSENGTTVIAVLLFVKEKKQDIRQFFIKYQNFSFYYRDMCESLSPHRFRTNMSINHLINRFKEREVKVIWNFMAVLGEVHLPKEPLENFLSF